MKEFFEKTLEDIIFNTDNELLCEHGLIISGKKLRQVKIGNYGIADLITYNIEKDYIYDNYLNIALYELKRTEINNNSLMQAIGYVKGIIEYLAKRQFENYKLEIKLIGEIINLNDNFIYLPSLFTDKIEYPLQSICNIEYYTYDYDFNGITFKDCNDYDLINKGF